MTIKNILTKVDKFNYLNWIIIITYIVLLVIAYPTMPDKIPYHISFQNELSNYASKKWIFILPIINIIISLSVSYFRSKPEILNYGIKVTEQNKIRLYYTMQRALGVLNLLVTLIFAILILFPYNKSGIWIVLGILGIIYFWWMIFSIKLKPKITK